MTKNEFLACLHGRLGALPGIEIDKTLAYYSEIIDDRVEDGMTEEAAVETLEDVETIAGRIIGDTPLPVLVRERMKKPRPGLTALNIVLLILGFPLWFPLLAAGAAVALALGVTVISVVIALFATVLAVGFAGIAGLVFGIAGSATSFAHGMFLIGIGLGGIGLCVLAFFGMLALTRLLVRLVGAAVRGIKTRKFTGEGAEK